MHFQSLVLAYLYFLPVSSGGLRIVRQWNELESVFPDQRALEEAVKMGYYTPGTPYPPIDVDVHYGNGLQPSRIFLTIPRFDTGRPVTLGSLDSYGRLVPYPDYSWHDNQGANCDRLTSVFRIAIDRFSRLWVLDNGAVGDNRTCPAQILAFDLHTDRLVFRHRVDPDNYNNAIYVNMVVDTRSYKSLGDDTFVYAADSNNFGLLVLDVLRNRSWKVSHRLFYPCPYWGIFDIEGESFELMDGILGLALSPESASGERLLYFHALASVTENVVSTEVLRNESSVTVSKTHFKDFQMLPGQRASQSAAEAMDRNGILFFGSTKPPAVYCWNSATEFSQSNFYEVAVEHTALQFPSGMKVVTNIRGEQELWVLSCRFQKYFSGSMTNAEANFRVLAEKVDNLLFNSPCLPREY